MKHVKSLGPMWWECRTCGWEDHHATKQVADNHEHQHLIAGDAAAMERAELAHLKAEMAAALEKAREEGFNAGRTNGVELSLRAAELVQERAETWGSAEFATAQVIVDELRRLQ